MCGLAGLQITRDVSQGENVLAAMTSALAHRGPDDAGTFTDASAGVYLGHRRLSIIDLTPGSHQPMTDSFTGVTLAYNGELYNYKGIREELIALGHRFHSDGDTEVVLRSYLQWGAESFRRFGAMFALAIWDPRSATLHLARDAMGMKPLYWLQRDEGVYFASEVKAFAHVPGYRPGVDPEALTEFMEFGYVFGTERTILSGVKKLEPGTHLEVRGGRAVGCTTWFTPPKPDPDDTRSEAERVDEFGAVLDEVVSQHLIADVPLGLLLSGGLDSSLIAALAAAKGPLLTISMGFDQSKIDERENAREVARFIGSQHVEVLISADEVRREAVEGAWVFDDLFADWGTVTTRLLYRRCRERGIKAVLVGEGADELFGGYDVFSVPQSLGPWRLFRLYQRYAGRRYGRRLNDFQVLMSEYLAQCQGDAFSAVRLFEARRQLPNQYVMKVDKASMAESVEARAPYLDKRVAEIAFRTPGQWLLRGGENKYLLRALARSRRLLPDAASSRPKFGAPLSADWMDSDARFRAFARDRIMQGPWAAATGLREAMTAYFDEGKAGFAFPRAVSIFRNAAWRLLLLELWAPHYVSTP